jgi:hypothetical protein
MARFSFQNMRTAEVVKGLREHSIDFGVLRKSAVVAPLKFHSIGQIGYALFAPPAWAMEKEDATALLRQRPVAIPAGGEFDKRPPRGQVIRDFPTSERGRSRS